MDDTHMAEATHARKDGARSGPLRTVQVLHPQVSGDGELLRRVQVGGPAAAAQLYDRFCGEINSMVWRLLGADLEHDDIVQHVFCELLEAIPQVRSAGALTAFVRSVTVHVVQSELRKRSIRRLFAGSSEDADRFATCIDDHEGRQLLVSLYGVLDRMPVAERVVLCLRCFEKRSVGEIADACGCSEATVKRRLAKAEERFRKMAQRDPRLAERMAAGMPEEGAG